MWLLMSLIARFAAWLKFLHALSLWESPRRHVVPSFVAAIAATASGTLWTKFAAHELRYGRLCVER